MAATDNAPFAIQLEVEFLDRLSEPVREGKAQSVSELIRTALERFNLENVVVIRPPQVMISVRLPREIRHDLKRVAREKHTSVGQLVRSAVESYLPHLETESAGQLEMMMPTAIEPAAPESPPRKPQRKAKPSARKKTKAPPKAPQRAPTPAKKKPAATKRAKR